MNLLYSQIIGKPIGALAEKAKVGTVKDIVVNPEDSRVLAALVQSGFLGWRRGVVDWRDMRAFDDHGVVVSGAQNVLALEEIVRVRDLIKRGFSLLGLRVITTTGVRLGLVRDFEINWEMGALVKIYVRGFWGPKRIIGRSAIVRIELDCVVVKNGEVKKEAKISKTCAESV